MYVCSKYVQAALNYFTGIKSYFELFYWHKKVLVILQAQKTTLNNFTSTDSYFQLFCRYRQLFSIILLAQKPFSNIYRSRKLFLIILQAQKAILDTELEIINKQYEGADTSELYQKVFELKKEAASLGLLSGNAAFLAGSRQLPLVNSNRRRSKSRTYSNSLSVDNRPKQIKIVGFALEEKASMLRQLKVHE